MAGGGQERDSLEEKRFLGRVTELASTSLEEWRDGGPDSGTRFMNQDFGCKKIS